MRKFIFDTNIYTQFLSRNISPKLIEYKGGFYTTNIQASELRNNTNHEMRDKILSILTELEPIRLNLDSGIWLDDLRWDDEQPWRDEIGKTCKLIVGNSKRVRMWKDALIGEVAKINFLTLVTNDGDFRKKAKSLNILTISFEEFLNL